MNPTQKKIVSIGFVLLGLLGIIAIFIARDVVVGEGFSRALDAWTAFIKIFAISFLPPALVVILVCLGIYIMTRDK